MQALSRIEVDRGKPGVEWWMICIKTECLQELEGGNSSAASFMDSVEESVNERECKLYAEAIFVTHHMC